MSYLAIDPDETGIEKIFDHLLAEKVRENFDQHQADILLIQNQALPGGGFNIYPTGVLGTNGIFPGTGDGQDWNLYNVKIQAWQSLVISDHTDTPRILFRTREGSIEAKGHLYCDEGMQAGSFNLTDAGAGLNGFYQGTGDGADFSVFSAKLKIDHGLVIADNTDTPRILFNARTGEGRFHGLVISDKGFCIPSSSNNQLSIAISGESETNSSMINCWAHPSNTGITLGTTRNDGTAFNVVSSAGLNGNGYYSGTGSSVFKVLGNGNIDIGGSTIEGPGKVNIWGNSPLGLFIQNTTNTNNEYIRMDGYNGQNWSIRGGHGGGGRLGFWEDATLRFSIEADSGNTHAPGNLAIGPGAGFGERVNIDGDLAFGQNQNIKFTNILGNRAVVLGQPNSWETVLRPACEDSGGTLRIQKNDGGLIACFTNFGQLGIGNATPDSILDVSGVISLKKETSTPPGSPTKAKIFSSEVETSDSTSKAVMHFVEEDGTVGRIMHGPIAACQFLDLHHYIGDSYKEFKAGDVIVDSHNSILLDTWGDFQFYCRVPGWYQIVMTVDALNVGSTFGTIHLTLDVQSGNPTFVNRTKKIKTFPYDPVASDEDSYQYTHTTFVYFSHADKIKAGVHYFTGSSSNFGGNIQIARIY